MNENEKGFGQGKQGQQGDTTGQDKNQQFGQDQQTELGQGQQNQQYGQDKSQQLGQGQQAETGQNQPGGDGSAFFGEGKPGEQGQQGQQGEQGQSAWPEKGRREDVETGTGSGESPDKSGGRY